MTDQSHVEKDDLLKRLAEHPEDESHWQDLYMQFWPFVFGTIYRLLNGNTEQARDLSQEIFIRLARYRPFASIRSVESFYAYLGAACRHIVYDFLKQSHTRISAETALSQRQETSEVPRSVQLREELQEVYHGLNAAERALLDLLIGGASTPEIAERLSISEAATRVRIHRLRARVKELLRRS